MRTKQEEKREQNSESQQGEKKEKKGREMDQSGGKQNHKLMSRGVGCNLGSAGDGFLGDVSD